MLEKLKSSPLQKLGVSYEGPDILLNRNLQTSPLGTIESLCLVSLRGRPTL